MPLNSVNKFTVFVFFTLFADGGGGGAGKPVPVGGRSGVKVSIPTGFGGGAGYRETGVGAGVLTPRPPQWGGVGGSIVFISLFIIAYPFKNGVNLRGLVSFTAPL